MPQSWRRSGTTSTAPFATRMRGFPGGAQAYLRAMNPIWNLVGRVSFHLAENKRDPDNPFAFLATYSSRVSKQARLQYLPLGRALEEYPARKTGMRFCRC